MSGVKVFSDDTDSDDIPTSALKSLSISKLHINSVRDLKVVNAVLGQVLPSCPKLEKMSFDSKIKKQLKPEDDTPFTTVLGCRAQEKLTEVYCDKRRYKVEAPLSSTYYRKRDNQLVKTGQFTPDKYYVTLLLSNPISLFDITENV